jgi:hypothetical protein
MDYGAGEKGHLRYSLQFGQIERALTARCCFSLF